MNIQQNLLLSKELQDIYKTELANQKEKIYSKIKELIHNLPLFTFCNDLENKDLIEVEEVAQKLQSYQEVIFLGIGGSSLGGQTVCSLASQNGSQNKKVRFIDNIDPSTLNQLVKKTNEKVAFVAISKSGNTLETVAQVLTIIKHLKQPQNLFIVTENSNNALREIAEKWQLNVIDHPYNIGGRFSVFSVVGMLPAIVCGLNFKAIRNGARKVVAEFSSDHSSISSAVAQFASQTSQTILMPYSDALRYFSSWFCQLWAESLGKINFHKQACGTTPIRALGTIDQHSQLQLYLDGPRDKFFTIITIEQQPELPIYVDDKLRHQAFVTLRGKSVKQLFEAEANATIETLHNHNCPVRHIKLDVLDEFNLGALMMHFILETLGGSVLLEVDPFNQPAVEESKRLTVQYLTA